MAEDGRLPGDTGATSRQVLPHMPFCCLVLSATSEGVSLSMFKVLCFPGCAHPIMSD